MCFPSGFFWQGDVPSAGCIKDMCGPVAPPALFSCGRVFRFGVEVTVYQRGYVVRVIHVMVRGGACLRCAVLSKACENRGPISTISRSPLPRKGRCVVLPSEGKVFSHRGGAVAGHAWELWVPAALHSPRPCDYLAHVKVGVFLLLAPKGLQLV